MALEDLKIRAMDGSALVEGRLALQATGPLSRFLPSAETGDLIGVTLWNRRVQRSGISLFKKWKQADDGLFAVAPPAISVEFGEVMPNLQRMVSRLWGQGSKRVELHSPDTRPGTYMVTVSFRPVGNEDALPVYGHLETVELEVARGETGLSIKFRGPLLPLAIEKEGPLLEDAWLDCEVVLPPAYCALASVGSYSCYEHQADWSSGREGLASIPLSYSALGAGFIDWGQSSSSYLCNGPFVQAYLHENELSIRPSRRLWLSVDGLCHAELDTDGPQVELNFGRSLLAGLLEREDRAEVSFRSGIGHIDGQTGRSVGECGGPKTQDIRRLDVKLVRSPSELRIEGEGELEPLAPKLASVVGSLGPHLRFSFSLQRTWLLAHGIELPRFWDDWKKDLGLTGVW